MTWNNFKKIVTKNRKRLLLTIFACIVLLSTIVITSYSLATDENVILVQSKKFLAGLGIYTEPIEKVEIQSDDYDTSGSWHIDKSAKWTGYGKAKITFDLKTKAAFNENENKKDVIFVVDRSGSMSGSKIQKVLSDSNELINTLLDDEENRVALISFENSSEIMSSFSNDKEEVLSILNTLSVAGNTNYNAAYMNIEKVLEGYEKEKNRDLVILFLTDGYPNEDTPNQIATYIVLKDKYPYMTINGVQYEMGTEIVKEIKEITDLQWAADMSTLHNALFEAVIVPLTYETFTVEDYIDPEFHIDSVNQINVNYGTVELLEENGIQKIKWSLNGFITGGTAQMEILADLKEENLGDNSEERLYPTNKKETITYKLPEKDEEKVTSTKTPVLSNVFNVIYDSNAPDKCNLPNTTKEKHFVYTNVIKSKDELSCDGYLFKGWEIEDETTSDVTFVNDDVFVMPAHDVIIRAVWSRQSVVKSMDGKVHEKTTLYKVLQNEAESGSGLAKEYTGEHQDSFENNGTEKIYHYTNMKSVNDKDNVLFGNMCWQMFRTTDTGGVKLLYNGLPDSNGRCGTDRKLETNPDNTYSKPSYASIGSSRFNASDFSWSSVGYMYNPKYKSETIHASSKELYLGSKPHFNISNEYWYADDIAVDEETGNYSLVNPYQITSSSSYKDLIGKYTFSSADENYTSTKVRYIQNVNTRSAYYLEMTNSHTKEYYANQISYKYGNNYIKNDDGSYTLQDITTVMKTNYSIPYRQYICSDKISETCNDLHYVYQYQPNDWGNYADTIPVKESDFKFAKSYVFEDGKYKLTGNITTLTKILQDANDIENIYTCKSSTETECDELYYAYDEILYWGDFDVLKLTNGMSTEDVIKSALQGDDVNQQDSTIKSIIDSWFNDNLGNYLSYIENPIYCNDRSNYDLTLTRGKHYFKLSNNLKCQNITDQFNLLNEKAKLKYPVALLNKVEMNLVKTFDYRNTYEKSSLGYWSMTPRQIEQYSQSWVTHHYYGSVTNHYTSYEIRPVISLIPGIEYNYGDGSMDYPYIIELNKGPQVTFNSNGGTVSWNSIVVIANSIYGNLPIPTKEGHVFLGWFTEETGGTQITNDTIVTNTEDHTLYAHWISLNTEGGLLANQTWYLDSYGKCNLPIPTKEGHVFLGWYTEETGGTKITNDTIVSNSENHTLYAHWRKKTFVTLDPQGGSIDTGILYMDSGERYTLLVPKKNGYIFEGWFTESEGGTQVTNETTLLKTDDHTLYARWQKLTATFNIINESPYYFAQDDTGLVFTSNNQNKKSTTAKTTLTFTESSTDGLVINWTVDSEASYDKLTITYNGTKIVNGISGLNKSGSYTINNISEGDTLIFEYYKDNSTDKGTDTATITLS